MKPYFKHYPETIPRLPVSPIILANQELTKLKI